MTELEIKSLALLRKQVCLSWFLDNRTNVSFETSLPNSKSSSETPANQFPTVVPRVISELQIGNFYVMNYLIYIFFYDPVDVGNLISGSSAFSKTSLNIWKFTVHVLLKPGLEDFKHYSTSV